jgi:hypothetical protein
VATWKKVAVLSAAFSGGELHALFSPDSSALLTGHGGGSFRVWNAATGKPLGPPAPAEQPGATCFAFSPDGRLVVVGHKDGTAQLWEVPAARPLGAAVAQPLGVAGVAFRPGGKAFITVAADGSVREWPVPAPLEGEADKLALALQLSTGSRLDAGRAVVPLTRAEWEALRACWKERYATADWRIAPPVPAADWHDARARDAEQTGNTFSARWHLERLAPLRPGDWQVAARAESVAARAGDWSRAAAEYVRARKLGGDEALRDWHRYHAEEAGARRDGATQCWHLTKLLESRPDDWEALARRAAAHVWLGR